MLTEKQLRDAADNGVRVRFRNNYMPSAYEGRLVRHGRHVCVLVVTDKSRIPDVVREHRYYKVTRPEHVLEVLETDLTNGQIWLILYLLDKKTPDRPYNRETANHYANNWGGDAPLEVNTSLHIKVANTLCEVYTRQEVTRDARQRGGEKGRRRYLGTLAERRRRLDDRFGSETVDAVLAAF